MHTDIPVSNGIRTHDTSVREGGGGSCLRPRGHCDPNFETVLSGRTDRLYHLSVFRKLVNVMLSLGLVKHSDVKTHGEWSYSSIILNICTRWRRVVRLTPWYPLCIAQSFVTSALDGDEWSGSLPGTHCIGSWVGPKVGLMLWRIKK
jgi:hypothetical protein